MFVWAIRDKGSEWRAIKSFLSAGYRLFTPLMEAVCEPYLPQPDVTAKDPILVLSNLGRKLASLADAGLTWVDVDNLLHVFSPHDVAQLIDVLRPAIGLTSHFVTPVVRTSSPPEILEACIRWANENKAGLCIRVDGVTHLTKKATKVDEILSWSGLVPGQVDLVVDAQDLPRAVSHELLNETFTLGQISRTWSVIAGSFPSSITDMRPQDYEHRRERHEWSAWREEIVLPIAGRHPSYGDFATQPAIYAPFASLPRQSIRALHLRDGVRGLAWARGFTA